MMSQSVIIHNQSINIINIINIIKLQYYYLYFQYFYTRFLIGIEEFNNRLIKRGCQLKRKNIFGTLEKNRFRGQQIWSDYGESK